MKIVSKPTDYFTQHPYMIIEQFMNCQYAWTPKTWETQKKVGESTRLFYFIVRPKTVKP